MISRMAASARPSHIATDSRGNLYLAATGAGMQKLTFTGMSGAR